MNDVLPNGRGTQSSIAHAVAQSVKAADAQAKGLPAQPGSPGTANVTNLVDKSDYKPELVDKGARLIMKSANEGANLTQQMLLLMRECGSYAIAKGCFETAEVRACELADEKSVKENGPRIKTLRQLAEANGMDNISWTQIKSRLFTIYEKGKDEYRVNVQRMYTLKEKHEGAPKTELQAGFCDPFHERYSDPKVGARQLLKDYRLALESVKWLDSWAKQQQQQQKQQQATTATNNAAAGVGSEATDAVTQMRSGDRQRADLSDRLQNVISVFTACVHNVANIVDEQWLAEKTATFVQEVFAERDRVAEAFKAEVAKQGKDADGRLAAGKVADDKAAAEAEIIEAEAVEMAVDEGDGAPELSAEDLANIEAHAPDQESFGPENAVG